MSISWMLLVCLAAGGLLSEAWGETQDEYDGLTALPPVPDPGPCTPLQNESTPVGLKGYGRYFANDSFIGRPVPCTREDKICFRHNLVFFPVGDKCDHISGGHYNCDLVPDRSEFEHGSGRIVGVCKKYVDPCPGYRMAYDGRCYPKEVVRDVICGCGAKPAGHFVDGVECRSSPATPIHIQQPDEDGQCLIPDLRFPDIERLQFFKNPSTELQGYQGKRTLIDFSENNPNFTCNSNQSACFAQKKVWVNGFQGCHSLLEQGPCPEEHVVALNIDAAVEGRAEATCVHVRGGCPPGHKRMLFDGECHEDREIEIEAPGRAVWNQFGQYILIPRGFIIWFHPDKVNDLCRTIFSAVAPGSNESRIGPPCGANKEGRCDLYEVEAGLPKPEM